MWKYLTIRKRKWYFNDFTLMDVVYSHFSNPFVNFPFCFFT